MEKGKIIGIGRTAEVYEYGEDKILKLYFDWFKDEWIKHEEQIGCALSYNGVPCPKIYGIVEEDGRKGIIYERIRGISMVKHIISKPWKTKYYARLMADIHNNIHSLRLEKLPKQKEQMEAAIRQSEKLLGDKTEKIIKYLYSLSDGTSVCHGDFHPDNILISSEGFMVIDWTNAYCGNPLGDAARTLVMLASPYLPPETSKIVTTGSKFIKKLMYSAYIKEYIKAANVKPEDIDTWMLPVAAARLRENVPGEQEWLMNIITERTNSL